MTLNLVVLTGRLTADAELKTTPNGVNVCSFDIAVNSGYGDNKQTNFIKVVAWRGTAEFISKYFSKGSMIGIEGSIQTRKYQDSNGNNRTAFEVVANKAHFVEGKRNDAEQEQADPLTDFAQNNAGFVQISDNGDLPF